MEKGVEGPSVLVLSRGDFAERVQGALSGSAGLYRASSPGEAVLRCAEEPPHAMLLDLRVLEDPAAELAELRTACAESGVALLLAGQVPALDGELDAAVVDELGEEVDWETLPARLGRSLERRRCLGLLEAAEPLHGLGSFEWDPASGRVRSSPGLLRLLGVEPELRVSNLEDLLSRVDPEDRSDLASALRHALESGAPMHCDARVEHPDGSQRCLRWAGEPAPDGAASGRWFGSLRDVSEEREALERVRFLADHDALTGLTNRRHFESRLARALAAARRQGHRLAVLYLDLDRFKRVNDTLGHASGDALLRNAARILVDQLRASDCVVRIAGERAVADVSRLGGDEFTVLLSKIRDPEDAGAVARRILESLAEPIRLGRHELSVTASIGIAVCPEDGEDASSLLKNADRAMYHCKQSGRNGCEFYDASMNAASLRRFAMESRLRGAIDRGELELVYQPRLDLASGRVRGAEALLRWENAELGAVSARELIPVAEATGLIRPIGRWVLETACAQTRFWRDAHDVEPLISVNVSPIQFRNDDLRALVSDALRESGLAPGQLEIEITEGVLMQDDEETALVLRDLRAMGVRVALDDFGTGYSALGYLSRFPLDTIKLDRAFVRDVPDDSSASGVCKAVIDLGHSLGVRVVAEGVDSEEQAQALRSLGCDEMQGFVLSPGVAPEEFVPFLRGRARFGSKG